VVRAELWLFRDGKLEDTEPCPLPESGGSVVRTFVQTGLERGSTYTFESRTSSLAGQHESAPVTVTIP
jgi:hypothetical protein